MPKTVVVSADIESLIGQIDTEDLMEELHYREDYSNVDDWDLLYQLLCQDRNADAIVIMKKMVQERTGRIIP